MILTKSLIHTDSVLSIDKCIAFLVVTFSTFFLTGVTQFSPVYFAYLLAIGLFVLRFLYTGRIHLMFSDIVILLIAFYLLRTQDYKNNDGGIKDVILGIMELVTFIVAYNTLRNCSIDYILRLIKYLLNISIVVLIVDFLYRYVHTGGYIYNFYSLKFNSLMALDSNFVGLLITCLFSLVLYFYKYYGLKIRKQLYLLFILAILTFSRTTIIACVLALLINKFWNGKVSIWYVIGGGGIIIGLFFVVKEYFLTDGSLLQRITILDRVVEQFSLNMDTNLLYGYGLGNTKYIIGKAAHNVVLTYLMEVGVIGFALYVILWTSFICVTPKVLFIFIPVFFNLMAVSGIMPYLYVSFALLIICERKNGKEKDIYNYSGI